MPDYNALIFVANKNHLSDPRLKKFLVATQQGVTYLRQHPKSAWQTFAKNHPEVNNKLNHQAWQQTLPYFATNPAYLDKKMYQQFAQFLYQQHLISKVLPLSDYAVALE